MGTLGRNSVEMFEVSRAAAQKLKFLIKEFFSTCDQIHRKLRIWLHLLRTSLMKTFIFCVVAYLSRICEKKEKSSFDHSKDLFHRQQFSALAPSTIW